MRKHLQHNQSEISVQSSHPGCMWGILHALKYHRWRHAARKRSVKRSHNGKHTDGVGNQGDDIRASKANGIPLQIDAGIPENSSVDDRMVQSSSGSKGSAKSRIKAIFSHEISRKKGKHRRSSTYPVRSPQTRTEDSLHPLGPSSVEDPHAGLKPNDQSPTTAACSKSLATCSPILQPFDDQNCGDCSPMLMGSPLSQNQVEENGEQVREHHSDLQENLVHGQEFNMHASDQQSKDITDALNMINMNKDFFIRMLQDPSSTLAHHFDNQQALSSKRGYSRSASFTSPCSSSIRDSGTSNPKQIMKRVHSLQSGNRTQESNNPKMKGYSRSQSMASIAAEYREYGIKLNHAMAKIPDNSSSGSSQNLKNQEVGRRFKSLKQKIKHVIKQSRKEKNRIARDAIIDKIPRCHGFSKDLKGDFADQLKDQSRSRDGRDSPRSSFRSNHPDINRASSFSESLDRYCQLYETSFNRDAKGDAKGDAKHHDTESYKYSRTEAVASPSKSTPKFVRICSFPDFKSHFHGLEDSLDAFSSSCQVRPMADDSKSSDFDKRKSPEHSIAPEQLPQLDTRNHVGDVGTEKFDSEAHPLSGDQVGRIPAVDDQSNAQACLISDDAQDERLQKESITEHPEPCSSLESKFQDNATMPESLPIAEEDHLSKSCTDKPSEEDGLDRNTDNEIRLFGVDEKDKAEFDYVRDILELSGYIGTTELHGTWNNELQPLDPSILEEVEGCNCMLLDPKCSGNEEGGNCNHMLLFDLINEVLVEIYSSSHTYYPKPLSALSHIRPMPVGYRVLEEVWGNMRWYLTFHPEADQLLDYNVSRDLAKNDGWMNLQYDAECVGLELDDMIFDDILDEALFDDFLEG